MRATCSSGASSVGLGDRDDEVAVEVGALLPGPLPQPVGVEVAPADEVGQQLAAHPALGLGLDAAEEQDQRRDQGAALQRAPFGQVHRLGGAQHERAEVLVARGRDGDPRSVPGLHAAARGLRPVDRVRDGRRRRSPSPRPRAGAPRRRTPRGWPPSTSRQHVTDLDDPAAVEQHVGEQVVCVGGALGRLRARPELGVGLVRRGNGSAGLLEEAGVLQGDRGVRGERGQQRHLARREGPDRAVHREQRTDDLALDGERHPEDGADLLALDGGVDVVAVHEPLVGLVVLGEVRRSRLRHQPEQPGAEWQPQLAELGGERTVGHLHVRRPLQLVVEREVGHVGVQQLPRPPDDGGQDRVEVPDRGEVASGLEERGQLGLPAALALHLLVDPQGECMLLAQRWPAARECSPRPPPRRPPGRGPPARPRRAASRETSR